MEAGDRIGAYRVLRRLGVGGMGEVYEAEGGDRTHVALKLFAADGAKADFFRRRFLVEARLLSRLSHPRLVKMHDFGVDDATERPYLAMDLVLRADGCAKTLAEVTPNEADEAQLALWFRDLASVIDYIHAEGVVHRDIKLNNVLVDSAGCAVLTDFGISRVCDERLRKEIDVTKTMLTGTSAERHVLGTRGYMAPELLRGEEATAASDAYALAASFFRLLTGVWYDPNLGAGGTHKPGRHVLGLADMLDSFEYNWSQVLGAMLVADPARRASTLAPLAKALAPKSASAPRRRVWPWIAALGAVGALVALVLALATRTPRRDAPVEPVAQTPPHRDAPVESVAQTPPRVEERAAPPVPAPPTKNRSGLTDGLFAPPRFMEGR